MQTATNKFRFNKFGMKEDPRGATVAMQYAGRDLRGRVETVRYDEVCGCFRLVVRDAAGVVWPVEPSARFVDVVNRV